MKFALIAFVLILVCNIHCISQTQFTLQQNGRDNCKVKLGNIDSTYVTAQQIIANPKLIPINPGCKVLEFTFYMFCKGSDYIGPYKSYDANFTAAMKTAAKNLRYNDRILIDQIKVLCDKDTCTTAIVLIGKKRV